MLKLFLNIIILNWISKTTASNIYGCNDTDISLELDEIAFFSTPDYPKMWTQNALVKCNTKFYLNETYNDIDNIKLFVFYSIISATDYAPIHEYDMIYVQSNTVEISNNHFYYPIDDFSREYNAKMTHFMFTNLNYGCPFESISNLQDSFEFTDETQILYLRSTYEDYGNRTSPCLWKFIAPDGYGFKIVVEVFNVSAITELTIVNSTDFIANERSLKLYHPYYNPDTKIQISLTNGDSSFVRPKIEFQAYVSIVKKSLNETDEGCQIIKNGTITFWTSMYNTNPNFAYPGYQNNIRCTHDLIIKNNTEFKVTVQPILLEKGVDHFQYLDDNEIIANENEMHFMLASDNNGSSKTYPWEFKSDGSVPSLGFQVAFEEMICKCAPSLIILNDQDFIGALMDRKDGLYCGNLKCNFTFQTNAVGDTIHANFVTNHFRNVNDLFRVYSNGIVVLEITDYNRQQWQFDIYLNSSNENIFEAISVSSRNVKSLGFTLSVINQTQPTNEITLLPKIPYFILDTTFTDDNIFEEWLNINLGKDDALKKATINIFTNENNTLWGLAIYNDDNNILIANEKNCFAPGTQFAYTCEVTSRKMKLHLNGGSPSPILVFQIPEIYGGCVFKENVFIVNIGKDFTTSAMANSHETCFITILLEQYNVIANGGNPEGIYLYPNYMMSKVWTTSINDSISVFSGVDLNHLYFTFNAENSDLWKDIPLFTRVYTILIPPDSVMLIKISTFHNNKPISISEYPFNSMVANIFYGTSPVDGYLELPMITYEITKYPIKFTAVKYNIAKNNTFFLFDQNKNFYFNKTGDSLTFKNGNISLFMEMENYVFTSEVVIFMETLNDTNEKYIL